MSFLSNLKKILNVSEAVAPSVVTAINPAAGAITGLIINAVVKAEDAGGSGPDKKKQVVAAVLPSVAPILGAVLGSSGAKINLDPTTLNTGIGQIVDGIVALLNSMQAPAAAVLRPPTTGSATRLATGCRYGCASGAPQRVRSASYRHLV